MSDQTDRQDAVELARLFHETYEELAPVYGYETRADTRIFNPESPNGKLMIAVCAAVLRARTTTRPPDSGGRYHTPGDGKEQSSP